MPPAATALGGALRRLWDGWHWADGEVAPMVRDMPLSAVAPNFRVVTCGGQGTVVDIPHDWPAPKYWPGNMPDPDAVTAIEALLAEAGRPAAVYAEGLAEPLDNHRLKKHGHHIPVAMWDAVMADPIGAQWDRADEAAILSRARALGWSAG